MEIYKNIPGWSGYYEVSEMGVVRSKDRTVKASRNGRIYNKELRAKTLKTADNGSGYRYVTLSRNGIHKNYTVHSLVAIAFLQYKHNNKHNLVIDHVNNNKYDNRLSNLQIITYRLNNTKDKIGKGTSIHPGVSWVTRDSKWISAITILNKRLFLLSTLDEDLAGKIYKIALSKFNSDKEYYRKHVKDLKAKDRREYLLN